MNGSGMPNRRWTDSWMGQRPVCAAVADLADSLAGIAQEVPDLESARRQGRIRCPGSVAVHVITLARISGSVLPLGQYRFATSVMSTQISQNEACSVGTIGAPSVRQLP